MIVLIIKKFSLNSSRKRILDRKEFITKLDASFTNDIAIQQMIHFLYSKKSPIIDTPLKFHNLLKCAMQFDLPELQDYLLTQVPEKLRQVKSFFSPTTKTTNATCDDNNDIVIGKDNYRKIVLNSMYSEWYLLLKHFFN